MRKIRAEKEFVLRWSGILTNGEPESLEGRELALYLINPYGSATAQDIEIENNTITARISAGTCNVLGQYRLKLYENKGKSGQTVLDHCEGFVVVATTCQEGDNTPGLDIDTVELSGGDMAIGIQGKSAYEIAVENGFEGTEEEWLESLKGKDGKDFTYSDFTPEQIAELQRPATEAAQLASQAASKADAAAQKATEAASVASQTEASIKQAETARVSAEQQRQTSEQNRDQAETERKQAEQDRATAEQGRVSAESNRTTAEQNRASAEQQRVTEFAQIKKDAETATTNANEAAEKANKAAEGITDRLSETYTNFAAIQASGETNPNKIYIDAEKQTSYIYLNGEYVSVGGGSNNFNYPTINPFNVLKQRQGRQAISVDPFYFQGEPILSCVYYGLSEIGNKFYGHDSLLALSLDGKRDKDYIGYYVNGYDLIFLHNENGQTVENTNLGNINSNINPTKQLYVILDFFIGIAAIYGWKQSTGIIEIDKRAILPSKQKFISSYIHSNIGFYSGDLIQKCILTNGYQDIKSLFGKHFTIGQYSESISYGYREEYKEIISTNVVISGISSSKVSYELKEGLHIIATVTGANEEYCSFKIGGNIPKGEARNVAIFVKFKIIEGECTIFSGAVGTAYILQNDFSLELSKNVKLDVDREYILVVMNSNYSTFDYVLNYSTKMTGTFKVEVLDAKVCLPHEQICCAERVKGDIIEGSIPMVTNGSDIAQPTPLLTTGSKQNLIGQQRLDANGSVYITIVDTEGNYVEKKITS